MEAAPTALIADEVSVPYNIYDAFVQSMGAENTHRKHP
jgi:hypothetical protein